MTAVSTPTGNAVCDGLAPRGMFWVAWRQRRSLILITLGLYAATAAVIVVRSVLRAREFASTGVTDLATCSDPAMSTTVLASCERWLMTQTSWATWDSQIDNLPAVICVLFGLGLGAAAVGHEFERGVGAFSFTQAISPMRWAAVQLTVVAGSSAAGVFVLDVIVRLSPDDPGSSSGAILGSGDPWLRPLLIVAVISLAFVLSIACRSSAGGFWGGLGVLVVGGFLLNFTSRPTATSSPSAALTCPNGDGEGCGRITVVVFRFRALLTDTASGTAVWPIALTVCTVVALVAGFLLLRRRFR